MICKNNSGYKLVQDNPKVRILHNTQEANSLPNAIKSIALSLSDKNVESFI
jgi:hypothetical protein